MTYTEIHFPIIHPQGYNRDGNCDSLSLAAITNNFVLKGRLNISVVSEGRYSAVPYPSFEIL
jgi:hypothetical protein